jgi:hypothetical protein
VTVNGEVDEGVPTEGIINGGTIYLTQFAGEASADEEDGEQDASTATEGASVLAIDFHGTYGDNGEGEDGESTGQAFFGREEGLTSGEGQISRVVSDNSSIANSTR